MAKLVLDRLTSAARSFSAGRESKGERNLWAGIFPLVIFCCLTFIIYSNTLNVPFVFDDRINISDNPPIRINELTVSNLLDAAFKSPVPNRPLANLSLALNYYIHKYELPGYHIVNIVIHSFIAIILYFFSLLTFRTPAIDSTIKRPGIIAFGAALIWLSHPLQTQSVTYVVQRMNSMATMFYLLSMLFYVSARFSLSMKKKIALFTGCALSGMAGFWSKEIVITLPLFLLVYEFFFFQDLDKNWLRSKSFIFPAIIIVLIGFIMIGDNIDSIVLGYNDRQFSLEQRLLTEPRVLIFHISQLFFPAPFRLNLFHDFPVSTSIIQPLNTLFSIAAMAGLVGLAGWLAPRRRLLSFGIFWYLGNLFLESSVIPLEIIFEHRNYLPTTFLCLAFSLMLYKALTLIRLKPLAPIILYLLIMTLSYGTYDRNRDWRNEEALLIDCLGKAPNVARTQASMGYVLMWQWRLDEATRRFQIALRLNPTIEIKRRILENMAFTKKMRNYPGYHKK